MHMGILRIAAVFFLQCTAMRLLPWDKEPKTNPANTEGEHTD